MDITQQASHHRVAKRLFPRLGKPRGQVAYLVEEIERTTRDTHSRRMFEIIADALPDAIIFQFLAEIRQGREIRNRGAVFVAAAKRWMGRKSAHGSGR